MRLINLTACVLVVGLTTSMNAFADDFNTVLKPAKKGNGFTEKPLVSGNMPSTSRNCGWTINDYIRNCGIVSDVPAVSVSRSKAVKS